MKIVLSLVAALMMSAASGYAEAQGEAAVGKVELNLLVAIFTGNIGLTIGLALCIVGIFKFFVKEDTSGGLMFVIIGVLLTMLPGVYKGLYFVFCPVAESLGGACGGGNK